MLWKRAIVVLSKRYFLLVAPIVALVASGVWADGCFVWKSGADLREPTQKAIIYWKDGREVLVLQVKYEGAAEDFAWIVPLPARPKVSAIDAEKSPFAEISLYTQLRRRWGYRGKDTADEQEAKVTVLERKTVGVYDIAIVAASEAGALSTWLNNNGYSFPEEHKDVLEHYMRKKWVYVAMRIDRKALESDEVKKLKTGELQPIRFAFAAREMVYPLKISSVNAGKTEVLLYLLADTPMVVKSDYRRAGLSIEENIPYAFSAYTMRYLDPEYGTYRKARAKVLPLTWDALGAPKDAELSLCRYRAVYKVQEMVDDLTFEPFKPVPYWKKQLRRERKETYGYDSRSLHALTVLASHDADLLRRYASDKDMAKRQLLASCPTAPQQLHLQLVDDEEISVRLALARNPEATLYVLRRLALDKDVQVRIAVAYHVKTTIEMIEQLANDLNKDVRFCVAGNWKTPARILRKLARDKISEVRRRAIRNPNMQEDILEQLARDQSPQVRSAVGEDSRTMVRTLRRLSTDNNHSVRCAVALNLNTPVDILVKLAEDKNFWVRKAIAYNPNTPLETLRELAKDKDANVSKAARSALEKHGLKVRTLD
jgi:hypothetical protein